MITIPRPITIACKPRPAAQTTQDYAADLHQALENEISSEYKAAEFFQTTYVTKAMRSIAKSVFLRLKSGKESNQPAIIRLNSVFGGGKTHTQIALAAAAIHPKLVKDGQTAGLLDEADAVDGITLICFNGENADLTHGTILDDHKTHRAKTLIGFLAYHLNGPNGLQSYEAYDQSGTSPGANEIQTLIGERPVLILIDELVHWIHKADQVDSKFSKGLPTTIAAIIKAVVNSPKAVMIITSPQIGADALKSATDQLETALDNATNSALDDTNSITSRVAKEYTPSSDDDLPVILSRRLFQTLAPPSEQEEVADFYARILNKTTEDENNWRQAILQNYPFHPKTLEIIQKYLTGNNNFQRTRGTLRAMAAVIHSNHQLDEPLIHPYHLDVNIPDIRDELVERTGHKDLDAAITADITGPEATGKRLGKQAQQAANTILLGSLTSTATHGLSKAEIVQSMLNPTDSDSSVAASAVQSIVENALYIDDASNDSDIKFNAQPNVLNELKLRTQAITAEERQEGVQQAIKEAFSDNAGLRVHVYPSRTNNLPDDPDQVHLGIINPDFITLQSSDWADQLKALHRHSPLNNGNAFRNHLNNTLFLVPSNNDLFHIRENLARHKAAEQLLDSQRLKNNLTEVQHSTLTLERQKAHKAVYQAIQRNWTNLFYPDNNEPATGLTRAPLNYPDQEGKGQTTIVDHMTNPTVGKMVPSQNPAISPQVWESVASPQGKSKAGITVQDLQERFTRTPGRIIFRNKSDFSKALDIANQEGPTQTVVIRTPTGLNLKSGSGLTYPPDAVVWLKASAPPEIQPKITPEPKPNSRDDVQEPNQTIGRYDSPVDSGPVIYKAVKDHLKSNNSNWQEVTKAEIYGADISLLQHIASFAQSHQIPVQIDYQCEAPVIGLAMKLAGKTAAEWQQWSRACDQIHRLAGGKDSISATASISAQGDAVKNTLQSLTNNNQIKVTVHYKKIKA